ncbi:MAG: hypothetical protein RLZZ31_919 [Actinomycetota bacterium]
MNVDANELLQLAVATARETADLLLASVNTELKIDTKTSATDLVTEIDRAAEKIIVERITKARPQDAILGEEGADRPGTSGVQWIIDPIDGTTNFVYGHPGFAVSIAAEFNGMPLIGVVHDPMHNEVFSAVRGQGAFCNGNPIAVRSTTTLETSLIATGFGYSSDRRRAQAGVMANLSGSIRDYRRMGAASVDLCSVACGRVDAYFERGLQKWDYAAGALIASEAGALLGDLNGGDCSSYYCIAATPAVFNELCQALIDAGAHDVP